ncbi:hypothetical protein GEMRC1_012186 [Eukaryota sp. GEM-RC1]
MNKNDEVVAFETVVDEHLDLDRVASVTSLLIYILFLFVFCIAFFLQRPSASSYFFTDGLRDILLKTEIDFNLEPHPKVFYELYTVTDIWNYLRSVFVNTVFVDTFPNGDPLPHNKTYRYVHNYNRLIGPARLRTMRVVPDSCPIPKQFHSMFDHCFDDLLPENEETQCFGPECMWTWNSTRELDGYSFLGFLNRYGGSGYNIELPANLTQAKSTLDFLFENNFIDFQTRVLFLDFTVYNSALNLFAITRLAFELAASGKVYTSATFRVLKLFAYLQFLDYVKLFFECLVVLFCICYTFALVRGIKKHGIFEYFDCFWKFWELFTYILIYIVFFTRLFSVLHIRGYREDSGYTESFSFAAQRIGFVMNQELNVLSVLAFVMFFGLFKFLELSVRLSLLTRVLKKAAKDCLAFSVILAVILCGYAFGGRLAFGIDLYEYRSLEHSVMALFRLAIGDFDYQELFKANRVIGPLFVLSFLFLVYLILLNMFLAIINDTFSLVREESRYETEDALLTTVDLMAQSFSKNLKIHFLSRLLGRSLLGLCTYLKTREVAARKVFGNLTATEILEKFDSNGDGILTLSEFNLINRVLENEHHREVQLSCSRGGQNQDLIGRMVTMEQTMLEMKSLLEKRLS